VLQKVKVRDWAFRWLFTPLKGEITYLKIGNLIMLGTPCDFSGEIFIADGLGKIAEDQHEDCLSQVSMAIMLATSPTMSTTGTPNKRK